ncbi:MAG: hypothetical protein QXD77_02315 [Candidatus Aenigmatarchaeota archaeon]
MSHFVVVLGGYPDVGKGVLSASIAYLLKQRGNNVFIMKFDGYFNINSGTMNHQELDFSCQYNNEEVFVLSDGFCGDSDSGLYERFLNTYLTAEHNLTNGIIFSSLIDKEKVGGFHSGKILEINDIKKQLYDQLTGLGNGRDFVIIEVGGTIGDFENDYFIDLLQEMKNRGHDMKFILLAPVIKFIEKRPGSVISSETKLIRMAVEKLKRKGIKIDSLICRSEGLDDIYDNNRDSLSRRCDIPIEMIMLDPKCRVVYELPRLLEEQGLVCKLFPDQGPMLDDPLGDFVERMRAAKKRVRIAVFGNTESNGSFVSLNEALLHSCVKQGALPSIIWKQSFDGRLDADCVILTDGFGDSKVLVDEVKRSKMPFLAICSGFTSVVRSITGSEPDVRTKRCGGSVVTLLAAAKDIYGAGTATERYRFNGSDYSRIDGGGIRVIGVNSGRPHMISLDGSFFVAVQFHPEYISRPNRTHPIIDRLIKEAIK